MKALTLAESEELLDRWHRMFRASASERHRLYMEAPKHQHGPLLGLAYGMSTDRLLDLLQVPDLLAIERWEGEGGQ